MSTKDHEEVLDKTMQAIKREAVREEKRAVIDFDAAQKEYNKDHPGHKVMFGGKEYEVPHSIPYKLAQTFLRYCIKVRNGEKMFEIPDDKIGLVLQQAMGNEFAKAVEESDADVFFVGQTIIPKLIELWDMEVEPHSKNGKTPAS